MHAAGGNQQERRTRVRRNHPDIAAVDGTRRQDRFLARESVVSAQQGSISTSHFVPVDARPRDCPGTSSNSNHDSNQKITRTSVVSVPPLQEKVSARCYSSLKAEGDVQNAQPKRIKGARKRARVCKKRKEKKTRRSFRPLVKLFKV